MTDELTTIYTYKGKKYESPPIKNFHVDNIEFSDGVKLLSIRRKIPLYIHVLIVVVLLLPIIKLNYDNLGGKSVQVRQHTLRIPSEMYYDSNTKVLDIDVTNDSSNFETVSFTIQDQYGNKIVELNGIKPAESIGGIPVDYKFKSLPARCTIVYKTYYKGFVYKDIKLNVLVVDRAVADKDLNRDF